MTKATLYVNARAVFISLAALCVCAAQSPAQTDAARSAPATVTGRVTDGKRPLAGVVVVLALGPGMRSQNSNLGAKTDADGRYRLGGVPAGRYEITPAAPAHVVSGSIDGRWGRTLMVNPGETIENVDFRLTRGGVITGRVTDSDGKPVVGEMLQITPEDNSQSPRMFFRLDRSEMLTDDRGVYRLYGLPAGRYRVSVGTGPQRGPGSAGGTQTFYPRTFYPGTTEQEQAKIVEVAVGGEATDIDINVNKTTRQTYQVSGRLVYAETGQPAANVRIGYVTQRDDRRGFNFVNFGDYTPGVAPIATDARGEFRADGLAPGRYVLFAVRPQEGADWYSDQLAFEVADANVEGLEVKIKRGASLSGSVQIEGVSDRAAAARLLNRAQVHMMSATPGENAMFFSQPSANVAPDGSFRLGGLRAGRFRIGIAISNEITLLRVEHNGVVLPQNTIEVAENAQITGVRVVVAYGTAVVRGQVNVTGGVLPDGWQVRVSARRVMGGDVQPAGRGSQVDLRGRFVMDGLIAGEYEIQAMAVSMRGGGGGGPGPRGVRPFTGVPQRVMLAEGGDQNITLVLNISGGGNQ